MCVYARVHPFLCMPLCVIERVHVNVYVCMCVYGLVYDMKILERNCKALVVIPLSLSPVQIEVVS